MPTVSFSIKDYSNQTGTCTFFQPTLGTDPSALIGFVEAVILGNVNSYTQSQKVDLNANLPASVNAQRGDKLLITYSDNVNGEYGTVAIPTVDRTALTIAPGSDVVLLADAGVMAALVNELETNYESRDGNAITVQQARVVERTN